MSEITGPDAQFAAFFQEWHDLRDALTAVVRSLGEAEKVARAYGEADSAEVARFEQEQKDIYRKERLLFQRVSVTPAEGLIGIAFKLLLWRYDAAVCTRTGLDQPYDACAFSAYRDLIRLAGLTQHAHPLDPNTERYITDPNGLMGEDWADTGLESSSGVLTREAAAKLLRDHADELRLAGIAHVAILGPIARNEDDGKSDINVLIDSTGQKQLTIDDLSRFMEQVGKILCRTVIVMPRAWAQKEAQEGETVETDVFDVF